MRLDVEVETVPVWRKQLRVLLATESTYSGPTGGPEAAFGDLSKGREDAACPRQPANLLSAGSIV